MPSTDKRTDPTSDPRIFETPPMECPPSVGDSCPQAGALREIRKLLEKIVLHLDGDGTEDRPGIRIEMDRIKQRGHGMDERIKQLENNQTKIAWVIIIAVILAVLSLVVVKGGPAIRSALKIDAAAQTTIAVCMEGR